MSTIYPVGIDTSIELPSVVDTVTPIAALPINRLRDAILAIERQLGIVPAGVYNTVRSRLDALEAGVTVVVGGGGSGNAISIQGISVIATPPLFDQVLFYDGTNWIPKQLSQDDILPSFQITGFNDITFGSLIEVGSSASSPAFTVSYSATPDSTINSVTVIDDQGNSVSDKTTTPTSFTYTNTYTKNIYGQAVTFTLTARRSSIIRTANSTLSWVQKAYYGVGTAGQNTSAFILSLTGNLTTVRNTTFTTTAGAGQKIYYAYRTPYGAATFTVGGFVGGFTLSSTTIAITNLHGITENYTLYESDNLNLGTTTVTVS